MASLVKSVTNSTPVLEALAKTLACVATSPVTNTDASVCQILWSKLQRIQPPVHFVLHHVSTVADARVLPATSINATVQKGFYGKTCQFFDPCSLDPCQNGGKCQNSSQVDYVCKCIPGYAGKQCEIDIDECASSPCKHGATCRDGINTFHCQCAPGYRGTRCKQIEHCSPNTTISEKGVFRWNSTSHGGPADRMSLRLHVPRQGVGHGVRRREMLPLPQWFCRLGTRGSQQLQRRGIQKCRRSDSRLMELDRRSQTSQC
ncbi:hypothetical protein CEXT_95801 [Caerostris extrusa]|uniref:EGF-like domain-containing protein n=1 Tax=Caerostris extrusa TaxID=172846 RepID=A0AAV4RCW7_CAEEX|nr:hypothetical protein CEXT_95801 [Caerostris extrusa]